MTSQNLFAITYNSDTTEGRGYTITLGYTHTRELADAIVSDPRFSKYCCMGFHNAEECRKYSVRPAELLIFESVDELYDREQEAERQKALAKLNPRERKILGLE
ncbi:hypothetical protein DV532_26665 (plasmid) [Pseudomonas sp. Leaf58]|uniref:hypothetical protein n=1 Tax=unclassified Pseudomonas TaxID=196821 RepID=UPI0006F40EC7|nr:hypothetical protein [Pseudomonas sp. Leaf58]AYG47870.1 hypothetical protein DV532_26665 [Pseudomonas sp. Leaf58]KQN62567.1 hypothetical protein ASF02_10495 [Pseudomonas sp. Leaf58]